MFLGRVLATGAVIVLACVLPSIYYGRGSSVASKLKFDNAGNWGVVIVSLAGLVYAYSSSILGSILVIITSTLFCLGAEKEFFDSKGLRLSLVLLSVIFLIITIIYFAKNYV